MSQLIRGTRRVARKPHKCERCRGRIEIGDVYLSTVASPDSPFGDIGNTTWWRAKECAPCAVSCGRGDLVS